jgi:hypothetical protein
LQTSDDPRALKGSLKSSSRFLHLRSSLKSTKNEANIKPSSFERDLNELLFDPCIPLESREELFTCFQFFRNAEYLQPWRNRFLLAGILYDLTEQFRTQYALTVSHTAIAETIIFEIQKTSHSALDVLIAIFYEEAKLLNSFSKDTKFDLLEHTLKFSTYYAAAGKSRDLHPSLNNRFDDWLKKIIAASRKTYHENPLWPYPAQFYMDAFVQGELNDVRLTELVETINSYPLTDNAFDGQGKENLVKQAVFGLVAMRLLENLQKQ